MSQRFNINYEFSFLNSLANTVNEKSAIRALKFLTILSMGIRILSETFYNKEIRIFAISILKALKVNCVPRLIQVAGRYCVFQEQSHWSVHSSNMIHPLEVEHIFGHTSQD